MSDFWRRALLFPFSLLLLSLVVWLVFSALAAALFFAFIIALRLYFHLRNLAAFDRWLDDPEGREVPEGYDQWEDAFSRLNKLIKSHRQGRAEHIAALSGMEQAASALPEGVVILDEIGHIEWCNPLAERHFGLDSRRDIGQQITYLARHPEFVQYLATKNFSEPLVLRGTHRDDTVLSVRLVAYGGNKRLLISRDITQMERVETIRRDFVANVSHELRTPLTVVNGFVETLHDMPNLENDMARRALLLMGEQTSRMANLVDDLLTLSRLENSQNMLQEEMVDVPELMRDLLEEGRTLSGGKHRFSLEMESSGKVNGSSSELRSAFGNLVSNAIRYTPAGGEIILRWIENDGGMSFSVQDSGIGIAPQHISRLTERFYRVDRSRSRETGGTGLGLAIVKHIVNRHQATLDVESEEGRGSTFSITFPASRRFEEAKDPA